MKIFKIELNNFLCFSGEENVFHFSDGLNLILGPNGYGKTKLFDAFQWVFFDGITNQKGTLTPTGDLKSSLISKKALETTNEGKIECSVSVELESHREQWLIERKYFVNISDGKLIEARKSTANVYKKNVIEYVPFLVRDRDEFFEFIKEKIIPIEILGHIWFQGERGIRKAVDTSNGKALHNVINNISYIDMWQRYIDVAENAYNRVRKQFDQEIRKSNKKKGEKDKLQREFKDLDTRIKNNKKILATLKQELAEVDRKIDQITFSEEVQEKIEKLKKEETKLHRDYQRVSERIDSLMDNADRNLFSKYWIIHGTVKSADRFDSLYKTYTYDIQREIESSSDNAPKIPVGNPTATHLKAMLENEQCYVCNRPATKGTEAYHHIERLLPENYPSANSIQNKYKNKNLFDSLSRTQSGLTLRYGSFQEESDRIKTEFFEAEEERKALEEELAAIQKERDLVLSTHGLESIDSGLSLGNKFQKLNRDSVNLARQIKGKEINIGEDEKKREDVDKRLQKLVSEEIDDTLKKELKFLKSLHQSTIDTKESQFQKLVSLLEEETNKHYENINIESGAFYGKVKFQKNTSDGYSARIFNHNGEDVTDNMNTSQILAMQLSILFAILSTNKQKGLNKRYPLIADAPNSAFDPKKRKFLLREIGKTFDQSIIMMFEYLKDDPKRKHRYTVDQVALDELKAEMAKLDIDVNVMKLDIPEDVNPKKLNELTVEVQAV